MQTIAHFETANGTRTEFPDEYHTDKDGFVTLLWHANDGSVEKKYTVPVGRVEFIVEKEQ